MSTKAYCLSFKYTSKTEIMLNEFSNNHFQSVTIKFYLISKKCNIKYNTLCIISKGVPNV